MNASGTRVAVIGFDSADARLLESWAQAGTLPTFRRLLQAGVATPITHPPGLYVGAVWPTLFTGLPPTRHGRYAPEQLIPGTYRTRAFRLRDYPVEPFWVELARQGRRVCIVDVPKSPRQACPGIFVWGWGTHDPEPEGFQCSPPEVAGFIREKFGEDPVGLCDSYPHDVPSGQRLVSRLVRRIAAKADMVADMARQPDWDLLFAVFSESHCAGHQFWDVHVNSGAFSQEARAAMGDPLETVYTALDRALGRVIDALPDGTIVLVLASHGMDSHNDANHLLADMIAAMHTSRTRNVSVGALQDSWHRLPPRMRRLLRRPLDWVGQTLSRRRAGAPPGLASALRAPVPSRLPYFAVPNNDGHGAVRLNLVGREPEGCVAPANVDAVIDDLCRGLSSFVNEATGRPVVAAVHRSADVYPGERVDDFPDLLIDWDRSAPIVNLVSPRFGRVGRPGPSKRTGDHRPYGLLLATGPGCGATRQCEAAPSTALAATVSALLGVERADLPGPELRLRI